MAWSQLYNTNLTAMKFWPFKYSNMCSEKFQNRYKKRDGVLYENASYWLISKYFIQVTIQQRFEYALRISKRPHKLTVIRKTPPRF